MTTITTSPVTINVPTGKAPLYCKYSGQMQAQPAHIEFDPETRVADYDHDGEIGGGVPMDVWNGLRRRYTVPNTLTAEGCEELGEKLKPLLARVADGFEEVWNGSNNVGRLDDDARAAEEEIERLVEDLEVDTGRNAQVWDASDWIWGDHTARVLAAWLEITAASTDKELDAVAKRLEDEAEGEGIVLDGSVVRVLDKLRQELIDTAEYEVARYEGEGSNSPENGQVVFTGTLDECKAWVVEEIGGDFGTWDGTDDDVVAYHESAEEGCGGYAIRPVRD